MSEVQVETANGVATVTMTNPPANLFNEALADGLLTAVENAGASGVRAMVLRSDGALFSGGVDVHLFEGKSAADAAEMIGQAFRVIAALEEAPFPVIAAVHGMCLAAGLEIALACDLIIAAEGTQFAQVEAKIGAATFLGGCYRLAQRAGAARAFEITFGGDFFDAVVFERWNIVNRVVPADQLETEALKWASSLAAGPTAAHAVTKKLVHRAIDRGVRETDRYNLEVATPLFETADMQNAVELLLAHGARDFIANHATLVEFTGK